MPHKKKTGTGFLVYLGFLSIVGFLSTDMYLPAFDVMRVDFDTAKSNIGLSLTIFLGGFAMAQLFWGPFSDKYGKPRAIIWGLLIFMGASIGVFLTHRVSVLLILRGVQAIGATSATVCWQALVVERFPSTKTAKVFSTIMPLVALSPALAPLLGAFIQNHWGWRYIFIILAVIAGGLILYSLTLENITSDNAEEENTSAVSQTSYFSFFKSRYYLGNVMIYAFCSAAFFAWLTGAPFFLKEMGYNESEIGLSFVPQTIAFLVGGYGYSFLSNTLSGLKLLPHLLWIIAVSLMALFGIAFFTDATLFTLLIPFCVLALCNGATYPIVVDQALKPFTKNSGKASALQNTLQLGACFLSSALVSLVFYKCARGYSQCNGGLCRLYLYWFFNDKNHFLRKPNKIERDIFIRSGNDIHFPFQGNAVGIHDLFLDFPREL